MKICFSNEINGKTYTCSVCGYTYNYYYNHDEQVNNEAEPFVELEEPLLHTVGKGWEPDRIERIFQYACPKCGVLQVDTNSL